MNKKLFQLFFIFIFTLLFITIFSNSVFAADPKLISTLTKAFEQIEKWLLKIATPAAAVAVASGLFMKKFSFGDEERIRMGKKLVRNSLFSYAFILAIDLVLSAIKALVG